MFRRFFLSCFSPSTHAIQPFTQPNQALQQPRPGQLVQLLFTVKNNGHLTAQMICCSHAEAAQDMSEANSKSTIESCTDSKLTTQPNIDAYQSPILVSSSSGCHETKPQHGILSRQDSSQVHPQLSLILSPRPDHITASPAGPSSPFCNDEHQSSVLQTFASSNMDPHEQLQSQQPTTSSTQATQIDSFLPWPPSSTLGHTQPPSSTSQDTISTARTPVSNWPVKLSTSGSCPIPTSRLAGSGPRSCGGVRQTFPGALTRVSHAHSVPNPFKTGVIVDMALRSKPAAQPRCQSAKNSASQLVSSVTSPGAVSASVLYKPEDGRASSKNRFAGLLRLFESESVNGSLPEQPEIAQDLKQHKSVHTSAVRKLRNLFVPPSSITAKPSSRIPTNMVDNPVSCDASQASFVTDKADSFLDLGNGHFVQMVDRQRLSSRGSRNLPTTNMVVDTSRDWNIGSSSSRRTTYHTAMSGSIRSMISDDIESFYRQPANEWQI